MFSLEFCLFLSVGGQFCFETDKERNKTYGFTLEKRAVLINLNIPIQYETQEEWTARQTVSIKHIESAICRKQTACEAKKQLMDNIKNRYYDNCIRLKRPLKRKEFRHPDICLFYSDDPFFLSFYLKETDA